MAPFTAPPPFAPEPREPPTPAAKPAPAPNPEQPPRADPLAPGTPLPVEAIPLPLFLSAGTADEVWPADQTLRLARRLEAAGRPPELYLAEGQGHGFDFDTEPELWSRLTAFLRRHLDAPG